MIISQPMTEAAIAARKLDIEAELAALGLKMEPSLAALAGQGHAITSLATGEQADEDDDLPNSALALATEWTLIEGPIVWTDLTPAEIVIARRLFGDEVVNQHLGQ